MKRLIVGNWKMNGSVVSAGALAGSVAKNLKTANNLLNFCDFVVCPPHPHLVVVRQALEQGRSTVELGAQDCSAFDDGAYTGDVSAAMLKDIGCRYVILGHSERRQSHGEKDETIALKAHQAHIKGLATIICVGEQEKERNAGMENEVVESQILSSLPEGATAQNTVIAYEPVWAIGTGKTATPEDVRAMHDFIREKLGFKLADSEKVRILYGGSVKPETAGALFRVESVNGALIGGASLKADQFTAIAQAAIQGGIE